MLSLAQPENEFLLYSLSSPGVVPPHSSLECEFVCQPTFTSASTAQFMLGIEEEGREESEREHQASNMLSLVAQVVLCFCTVPSLYLQR